MSKKLDFIKSVHGLNESDLTARIKEDELRLKKLQFAHSISPSAGCRARKATALQQTIIGVFLRLRSTNTTHLHAFSALAQITPSEPR